MKKSRKEYRNHPTETRVQNHKYKKRHVWAWVTGIIVLVAVVATAAYFASVYFRTKNAVDKTYDPQTAVKTTGEFNGKKRFVVLLMGTDTGALDRTEKRGRTDTMILAVVNPTKKHYTLVSIPRDTMAQMIGYKDGFKTEKINAAYELGGAKMSMDSVSKLINVPIKYYAVVNMGGIMKMIRYVGGINIRPTLSFEYGGYIFKKGKLTHMGGAGALAYSRMRYDDPRGDYGRQERQRQVITTLIKKAISVSSLSNLDSILTSISSNVRTNLPFSALQEIATNYRGCAKTSSSDYLHGYNAMIDDAAYQVQPTSELQRISNKARSELGLERAIVDNNETFQNERNIAHGFDFKSGKTQDYHIYDYTESADTTTGDDGN